MNVYSLNRIGSKHRTLGKRRTLGQISIEYVVVIALVALGLAGIIYYFTKGRHETSVNSVASAVTTMAGAAQKQYNGDPNGFANVTAQALINNGDVPSPMVQGANIVTGFGTPVTVAPATTYNANDSVSFSFAVPPSDCSNFVQAVASNFNSITVGGTAVKNAATGLTSVSNTTLGTQCTSTNGGQVPLVLTASL